MKMTIHTLLAACLILVVGCGEEETFTRYPSLSVPKYTSEDYTRDLSNPEPELVYNAICNLGRSADQFSKTLCADDADPASPEYKSADELYRAVCGQLESKESYTVAASLRFLQRFARNYEPKEELLDMVCKVESKHPQVQFEQVTLLRSLASESSQLPESLMQRLLDSPSWIVSRTTYDLIGRLQDNPLRQELVRRYRDTEDERERLILIAALSEQLEPEDARMFEQEMFATEIPRMRYVIGMTLMENLNVSGVKQWLSDHYPQLNDEEKTNLFMASFDDCSEGDIDFACQILAWGYIPDDEFLEGLAEPPAEDEEEEERVVRLRIEKAIKANPQLAGRLQTMKDEIQQEQLQMNTLREEIAPLSLEFTEKVQAVLTKHEMPESEQEEFLKEINDALSL